MMTDRAGNAVMQVGELVFADESLAALACEKDRVTVADGETLVVRLKQQQR